MVAAAPGAVMVVRESDALEPMLRDMLRYSTNLTAEVVGAAGQRRRGGRRRTASRPRPRR